MPKRSKSSKARRTSKAQSQTPSTSQQGSTQTARRSQNKQETSPRLSDQQLTEAIYMAQEFAAKDVELTLRRKVIGSLRAQRGKA